MRLTLKCSRGFQPLAIQDMLEILIKERPLWQNVYLSDFFSQVFD